MAEAPPSLPELGDSQALEKLNQELTCPVCLNHFEEPKVLPCCHYYCKGCVADMRARVRGKGRSFPCPECRKDTLLPDDKPDNLPPAFFINRMKEVYSIMQKAQGKVEVRCENCNRTSSSAKAFCRHCALFFCSRCEEAHQTMRTFSEHIVVSLDDLRQNTAAHMPIKKEAALKCKEHTDEAVKLYCYNCEQLICRDCTIIDHNGHRYEFINKAAVKCRATLEESVAPVRKIQAGLVHALKGVETAETQVMENGTTLHKTIDQSVDKLVSVIEKRRKELHSEATKLTEQNQTELIAYKKDTQLAMAEVESLVEFVDRNCQTATDQELFAVRKQVVGQVGEVFQKYQHPKEAVQISGFELFSSKEASGLSRQKLFVIARSTQKCGTHILSVPTSQLQLQRQPIFQELDSLALMPPSASQLQSPQQFDIATRSELLGPTTIIVTGFKGSVDEELLKMFFENPKSGGCAGGVEQCSIVAQGIAHVKFQSPNIASRVISKSGSHTLQGSSLHVEYYDENEPLEGFESNRLRLHKLPPGTGQDFLQLYLEGTLQMEHPQDFSCEVSGQTAVIIFTQDHSGKELSEMIARLKNKPLKGACIEAELCRVTSSIRVSNITKHYKEEFLEMYFANPKKSGGGEVTSVELLGNGEAVVTFKEPKVLNTILKRSHDTFGRGAVVRREEPFDVGLQKASIPPLEINVHPLIAGGSYGAKKAKECPICLEVIKNPVRTGCGHVFCSACINTALRYDSYCPTCRKPLRTITGKQPKGGKMTWKTLWTQLPGYTGYKTIQIIYDIPGGTQGQEHPNPGHPFTGTHRVAYLPDNPEGREVLELLKKAFDARLTFTVGTSVITGAQNTVVWNDINHKTNIHGGFQSYGYPDPTYLKRVKDDLAANGIVRLH